LLKILILLTLVPVRRVRLSKRAESQDSPAKVGSSSAGRTLCPDLGEKHGGSGFASGSEALQNDHLGQPPNIRQEESSGRWHEQNHEQAVLVDLDGSKSAMDITKKVRG
jgi:hypothetical protein